jgi:hypothetical protein
MVTLAALVVVADDALAIVDICQSIIVGPVNPANAERRDSV